MFGGWSFLEIVRKTIGIQSAEILNILPKPFRIKGIYQALTTSKSKLKDHALLNQQEDRTNARKEVAIESLLRLFDSENCSEAEIQ